MPKINQSKHEQPSLIILSDGAKVVGGVLIPESKQLKKWIAKNHPEYSEECEANREFEGES